MSATSAGTRTGLPIETGRLGMIVFLSSWSMAFVGGIGAFLVARLGAPAWPPGGLPAPEPALGGAVLAVLVLGSVVLHALARGLRQGRELRLPARLRLPGALGLLALGLLGAEWTLLSGRGLHLGSGSAGNYYYGLTGFHGLHVAAGLVLISVAWIRAVRGGLPADLAHLVDAIALYWNFLSAVWALVFLALYLL